MNKLDAKERALAIMDDYKVGSLATVKNGKPHSRYMTFFHEKFTLFTPTSKETYKTEEVEENPAIHVLLGYDGEGFGDEFIEFQGKAVIREGKEWRERFWNDTMGLYFDGPEDESMIILELQPETIRLMNSKDDTPETVSFT
ncbi:pyridoxamine 5'-phosphate oxidase family protein [Shouchella shacheensis]|uniref:pyridoxamine 5'-phosphate oxidase family protein n=1 Tax=Shouchella shacheensis TaxID=1649580 RepID=UPI00073FCECA|nr:pyridoxamine 5'-phosphate oxidase family protein [Shouchella shacheensis]